MDLCIDALALGDRVYSRAFRSPDSAIQQVAATINSRVRETVIVTFEHESLESSLNHPYYTQDRGWVAARDIHADDQVMIDGGSWLPVTHVARKQYAKPVTLYNIEVSGEHNYFIGSTRVLVHNQTANPNAKRIPRAYNGIEVGPPLGDGDDDGHDTKDITDPIEDIIDIIDPEEPQPEDPEAHPGDIYLVRTISGDIENETSEHQARWYDRYVEEIQQGVDPYSASSRLRHTRSIRREDYLPVLDSHDSLKSRHIRQVPDCTWADDEDCEDNDDCRHSSCNDDECEDEPIHFVHGIKSITFGGPGRMPLRKQSDGSGNPEYAQWLNDKYNDEGDELLVSPSYFDENDDLSPEKADPVAYERGSNPTLSVRLTHCITTCSAVPVIIQARDYVHGFTWEKSTSIGGSSSEIFMGVAPGSTLANVGSEDLNLDWYVSYDEGDTWNFIQWTQNRIFVAWDDIGQFVTCKRMDWVCTNAANRTTPDTIARWLHLKLVPLFDANKYYGEDFWKVLDPKDANNGPADCITLSRLLKDALRTIGLPGAEVWYVYGSSDTAGIVSQADDSFENRSCPDGSVSGHVNPEILIVYDGVPNKWEACCVYDGKWYPGGMGYVRNSGLEILREWLNRGATQMWVDLTLKDHPPPVPSP